VTDHARLIAELRAEAAASEELHPGDSCIDTMRRAADALEAERKVRAETLAAKERHYQTIDSLTTDNARLTAALAAAREAAIRECIAAVKSVPDDDYSLLDEAVAALEALLPTTEPAKAEEP
jgi:hypothetical protein